MRDVRVQPKRNGLAVVCALRVSAGREVVDDDLVVGAVRHQPLPVGADAS